MEGDELVLVGRGAAGLGEIARHQLSTPGHPRICDEHYPHHPAGNGPRPPKAKARSAAESAFLGLGQGAERWLIEAGAVGAQRVRSRMAAAAELAALFGVDAVDRALGLAAVAGRFDDGALGSVLDRLRVEDAAVEVFAAVLADEAHSAQPGTGAWKDRR